MIDNGNGTVTDEATGLMWQQKSPPPLNWEDSIKYCSKMTLVGYTDWRMPTIQELKSIVDYNRFNPAINTTYFPNTALSFYWSSTVGANYTFVAWGVFFDYGFVYYDNKIYNYFVRAVRTIYGARHKKEQLTMF